MTVKIREDVDLSIQPVIKLLEKLVQAHELLFKMSKQKTEDIKGSHTEQLQATLIKEQKQVQSIELIEAKRLTEVNDWLNQRQLPPEKGTITHMLEELSNDIEKEALENVTVRLSELIVNIKQQEQLNQALLQQSMQFVQLSLNMMQPSIENMNYHKDHSPMVTERSLFDSKA